MSRKECSLALVGLTAVSVLSHLCSLRRYLQYIMVTLAVLRIFSGHQQKKPCLQVVVQTKLSQYLTQEKGLKPCCRCVAVIISRAFCSRLQQLTALLHAAFCALLPGLLRILIMTGRTPCCCCCCRIIIQVSAADCDVNVISWNVLVSYMLASGADDGGLRVWDLRAFKEGGFVTHFNFHK